MRTLAITLALACALLCGCRTNVTPEQQVNDVGITANIKSKLASEIGISTIPDVSVNSTNGVVTLSGQVDSAATRARVEDVAKSVPKVVRVVDNLQVAQKPS
jgi:hyperosmotically inducible periplasmic protein